MTGTPITLSAADVLRAVAVAVERFHDSRARRLDPANARHRDLFTQLLDEANGACGEAAWCRFTGEEWTGAVGTFHRTPDAQGRVEVRTTHYSSGKLILQRSDHPERWFVLVTGKAPRFVVRGWIRGTDAMTDAYWQPAEGTRLAPGWWVPQSALTPPGRGQK